MLNSEAHPSAEAVVRYGNLLLSAWSPPSHQSLADSWLEAVIEAMLRSSATIYLLGFRPGKADALPADAVPQDVKQLVRGLTAEPIHRSLYRLSEEVARESGALLKSGDVCIRQWRTDESTGARHLKSTHLGRVLVKGSMQSFLSAIRAVSVAPPLQIHLSCLTNPQAGLRQPDAQWLRLIPSWTGDLIAATWSASELTMFASSEALLELRDKLLTWLFCAEA